MRAGTALLPALWIAAVGAGVVGSAAPVRAASVEIAAEPGAVRPDGSALVPFRAVDESGAPFRLREGELSVLVEGEAAASRLVSFGPGGEPWSLVVLLDPSAFRGADVRGWAAELVAILGSAGAGESFEVLGVGSSRPLAGANAPPDAGKLASFLESGREVRLWDEAIRALDRLSGPGPSARRVLLLVSDGEEGRESRLPVASVADAADSVRVSIWTLAPGGGRPSEAGRARLASLARRTGGRAGTAEAGRGADALRDAVASMRATQGVLVPPPAAVPAQVVLRPGVAAAGTASGWIRERRRLAASGGVPGWLLPAVLLVLAGSTVLVLRRRLPIGRVVPRAGRPITVTRAGLTVGGAVGNSLVLEDDRVSRNHAVIRMEGRTPVLVDLRSSNGTTVNGRRITRAELADGDRIVLAEAVELRWERFRFGRRR